MKIILTELIANKKKFVLGNSNDQRGKILNNWVKNAKYSSD